MVKNFDHVTIVVRDVDRAKEFFRLLGFEEDNYLIITGEKFARYMGVENIEAEHHTLVLTGSSPRMEVQLLKYLNPDPILDPNMATLRSIGFNHICFSVTDLERTLRSLTEKGFAARNEVMEFNDRKLVFLVGPEGVTVELAQWDEV